METIKSTDPRPILHRALNELAIRCDGATTLDGQGYAKGDSWFGKQMAQTDPLEWDEHTAWVIYETVRKYQSQVSGYGIDFEAIPPVARPATEDREWTTVRSEMYHTNKRLRAQAEKWATQHVIRLASDGKSALVVFPFDRNLIDALKQEVRGARFDGMYRRWYVTLLPASAFDLLAFIEEHNFTCDDDLLQRLSALAEQYDPNAPEPVALAPEYRVEVRGDKNGFNLFSPYNPALVEALKTKIAFTSRRFQNIDGKKYWTVDLNDDAVEALKGIITQFQFTATPDAAALLGSAVSTEVLDEVEIAGMNGTPYDFQRESIQYALRNKRVFLAEEQGLGKTLEFIGVVASAQAYPALVVCPASLKRNWENEVHKWLGDNVTVEVLNGKPGRYDAMFTIVNYDVLGKHLSALKGMGLKAVGFDEAHYVKNSDSQRSQAALRVVEGAEYVVLMTGTPVMNRPKELVHPLTILGRFEKMFGSFFAFGLRYCDAKKVNGYWDFDGHSHLEELNAKLRGRGAYIRHLKKDVLTQLPPKVFTTVPMELDNWDEYEQAESDLVDFVARTRVADAAFLESIKDMSEAEQRQARSARYSEAAYKASQAEQLVRFEALKQVTARGKFAGMVDWVETFLEGGEEKLVLFADHIEIQKRFIEALAKYNPAYILGGQSAEVTEAQKARFMGDPDCRVIVCSIKAGGVGHTLTAASHCVIAELPWRPADIDQAADRIHRIGQEADSVNIWFLLAANTMDSEMGAVLDEKRQVVTAVTDGNAEEVKGKLVNEVLARIESRRSQKGM